MMQTFVKDILRIEKSMIWVLVVFSITISICSLIVPLALQAIVNTIAFSLIKRQLLGLSFIVIIVLALAGVLRSYQFKVVEYKEQEIFTRLSLGLAQRLPRLKTSHLQAKRNLELVNLFLEVIPVQKTLAVILIYLIEMSIQALTGFTLLAFYHPYFLVLDISLIVLVFLSLYIPFKSAKKFAEDESTYKHKTISWLEEYLECANTIKFTNNHKYLLKKVDDSVAHYLKARSSMLRKILHHFFGLYSTYTVANAALLSLGGYLVFKAELSLGQLVSAELVLNIILSSFLKLSYSLGTLYELTPACNKATKIYKENYELSINEISEQEQKNINAKIPMAPTIKLQNISFKNEKKELILKNLNATLNAGTVTGVIGSFSSGKSLLLDLLAGFTPLKEGAIFIEKVLLSEHSVLVLRERMAFVKGIEIINDSLLNNLAFGNPGVEIERIHELFSVFGLSDVINRLPEKINTNLVSCQHSISSINLYKLMMIRAIVANPIILLVDNVFDVLPLEDAKAFKDYLEQLPNPPTTLISTANEDVAKLFDHKVVL